MTNPSHVISKLSEFHVRRSSSRRFSEQKHHDVGSKQVLQRKHGAQAEIHQKSGQSPIGIPNPLSQTIICETGNPRPAELSQAADTAHQARQVGIGKIGDVRRRQVLLPETIEGAARSAAVQPGSSARMIAAGAATGFLCHSPGRPTLPFPPPAHPAGREPSSFPPNPNPAKLQNRASGTGRNRFRQLRTRPFGNRPDRE